MKYIYIEMSDVKIQISTHARHSKPNHSRFITCMHVIQAWDTYMHPCMGYMHGIHTCIHAWVTSMGYKHGIHSCMHGINEVDKIQIATFIICSGME